MIFFPGELSLNIKVSHVVLDTEEGNTAPQTKREMTELFYDAIIQRKEQFCWTLESAINIRDVTVETIARGSICVKCSCLTLGALESLNQMCKTRRLSALCQSVFVTESVLDVVRVKSLKLDVTIDTKELEASREVVLSRKFNECTLVHPADTLTNPTDDPSLDHIPITTGQYYAIIVYSSSCFVNKVKPDLFLPHPATLHAYRNTFQCQANCTSC